MKAVTVGSATIDYIAIVEDLKTETRVSGDRETSFLLLEQGRKNDAEFISQFGGGGAVNAAVCLTRLGLDVECIAKVGHDHRADTVVGMLAAEGISTRRIIRTPDDATGASLLIAGRDRDNTICTYRGANTLFAPEDFTTEMLAADLVYVGPLSGGSADALTDLTARARAAGATVAVNPGIRQLTRLGGSILDALDQIDVLSMNRTEAEALIPRLAERFGHGGRELGAEPGSARLAASGLSAGEVRMSLPTYMAALSDLGVGRVVITDGHHGAYAGDGTDIHYCAVEQVDVVGTVGAGDAFASTFAARLCLGDDAAAALAAASVNSASVIRHIDAQTGLLTAADLAARVEAAAERVTALAPVPQEAQLT